MTGPMRLLLVDDLPLMRAGTRLVLEKQPVLQVIGEATSMAEVREVAARLLPDLLVANFRLPDGTGTELAQWVKGHLPQARIILLSAYGDEPQIRAARQLGIAVYVSKSQPEEELIAAVWAVLRGETANPPGSAQPADERLPEPLTVLTPRELEVARLIQAGQSDREIVDALQISIHTVHTHVLHLREKLKARNRTEIAACLAGAPSPAPPRDTGPSTTAG